MEFEDIDKAEYLMEITVNGYELVSDERRIMKIRNLSRVCDDGEIRNSNNGGIMDCPFLPLNLIRID